jgi:hypothetical protein
MTCCVLADEPPKPAAPVVPVEKLIEQLGGPEYKVREAASRALAERGEVALEAMRKAAATTNSAEVRNRLTTLIASQEKAIVLSPKRITIKMKDRPLQEAITEIAKQTGYRINLQNGQQRTITLDMEKATFWQVMDRICLEGGYTIWQNEGQPMQLWQQGNYSPFNCYQGPFKIVANSIHYSKSINLAQMPLNPVNNVARNENMQFQFTIQTEPKLPIMSVGQTTLTEALDEQNKSMVINGQHNVYYGHNGSYRQYNASSQVQLTWPNKESKTIKSIKGSIPVTLLAGTKPEIVIDDILKVLKDKKQASFSGPMTEIQIADIKEQNKTSIDIKMTVRNMKGDANDYNWSNSVPQHLEVQDAAGRKYFTQITHYEANNGTSMTANFNFNANGDGTIGPPAKLVYYQWTMLNHQIEFEFKDVPLP